MKGKKIGGIGAALMILAGAAVAVAGSSFSKTWTDDKDWAGGVEVAVNHTTVPDQLQLDRKKFTTPYIWIANCTSNTVAQIETLTGVLVGAHPVGSNPSRTAIDIDGNVWVANRGRTDTHPHDTDTVTKLDGTTGALLGTFPVGDLPRGLAIDAKGFVWVANWNDMNLMKLDRMTGAVQQVVPIGANPYGLAIDGKGFIWSSNMAAGSVTKVRSSDGAVIGTYKVGGGSINTYGIAVDEDGNVWTPLYVGGLLIKVRGSDGVVVGQFPLPGGGQGRGVAVDGEGNVWVANSGLNKVHKFRGIDGLLLGSFTVGSSPIGVAADSNNQVWAVNYGSNNTHRMDLNGNILGVHPTGGNNPYSYSDMTGFGLKNVTLNYGTWTGKVKRQTPLGEWQAITWTADTPVGTDVTARVRAAADEAGLAGAAWSADLTSGSPLTSAGDQPWLEVEVKLITTVKDTSPIVYDVTVAAACTPTPEVCDAIDNDCNGLVDDGVGGDEVCTTGDKGQCALGRRACLGGLWICAPQSSPTPEVCDGVDNDCDGVIDNGLTNACGECGELGKDVCDGKDNDCDGVIDEDATCPNAGERCINGVCVRPCAARECNVGFVCREVDAEPWCLPLCQGVDCPFGQTCDEKTGECVDKCVGLSCGDGETCLAGNCVPSGCYSTGCEKGNVCKSDSCVSDPCAGVSCEADGFCRDGACVKTCAQVSCAGDESCKDGECVKDPCALLQYSCAAGQTCVRDACTEDLCAAKSCPPGYTCNKDTGECVGDDACSGVVCPLKEICKDGQCVRADVKPPKPPIKDVGPTPDADGGDDRVVPDNGGDVVEEDIDDSEPDVVPKDYGPKRDAGEDASNGDAGPIKNGCGCSPIPGAAPAPNLLWLLFLGVPFLRRGR